MMEPIDLDVLVHCHTSLEKHPRIDAPAVKEAIERFLKDGVIEPCKDASELYATKPCKEDSELYTTTTKGRAWLKMILNTPQPRQVWLDENDQVINLF